MSETFILLDAVTSSTTGSTFRLPVVGRPVGFVSFQSGPGGFGSAFLQGSFDGVIWFPIATQEGPGEYDEFGGVARYIRAVYSDDGLTGAITIQALQSDED